MRTEDDLRAAFTALERHAPDAARVLPAASRERQAPASRLGRIRPQWRIAVAVLLALGVTAGVLVAMVPSRPPALTVQLLADRAATAALASPDVSAGQWVYQVTESTVPGQRPAGVPHPFVQSGWMTADGTINYGAGSIGDPIYPYGQLSSLPSDPAKLDAYFVSQDPVKTDNQSVVAFSQIEQMLFGMVLPPALEAEMFHALALIPMVQVKEHVEDIAGRAGVAFVLPPTKQSLKQEIILDASDYHLLARGSWDNPNLPAPDSETATLKQYLVAALGSTQPSTAPPTAAELAVERMDFGQQHLTSLPATRNVAPGQWLYRDLRTDGQDRQVWATADDSEQAGYVNGTLQVCKRADSCAASQQWLMPSGPAYTLVHPQYPRLTKAQVKRSSKLNKASVVKPGKPLPTLPEYPGPLLAELNGYSTRCSDVAGDCNAVNVVANMLTGYGNYPFPVATWFYALAAVPGVAVHDVTDAAGQKDLAFTFPFQDGVTAILVDASTFHYAGYVRDGQQTLVLSQALVSGPGERP